MIGNIISTLKVYNKSYNVTLTTNQVTAVMDILMNKLSFNRENLSKTFMKHFNSNTLTIEPSLIPLVLCDIGYNARDNQEIENLIKLFYEEMHLDKTLKENNYIDTLVICNLIYMIHKDKKIEEILDYYNKNENSLNSKTKKAFENFRLSSSYEELITQTKSSFDPYISGISLCLGEIRYKYIPLSYIRIINNLMGLDKNCLNLLTDYLIDRNYSFANIEDIDDNTKFLVTKITDKDNKTTYEYNHSRDLRSLSNYLVYEEMEVFSKFYSDDLLDDIKSYKDYEAYIKEYLELYNPQIQDIKILNELLKLIPEFLQTTKNDKFIKTLEKINELTINEEYKYEYILIDNPIELLKYISLNDNNNHIYDYLLKL